jgi:Parvulin-like peptidyl-prolyl isomerase
MKKVRISAMLTAICIMAGMCLSGCKQTKVQNSSSSSQSTGDAVVTSDTGLSMSIGTGESSANAESTGSSSTYVAMTYDNNYDAAAIAQMGKTVKIRDMQFTALDYNFYFANEYNQLLQMSLYGQANIPMTGSGFPDMNGKLTEELTVAQYLQNSVISDFQGEVWLLEYSKDKNLKLDDEILAKIEEQFTSTQKSAESIGLTLEEYLQAYYGPVATADGLREVLQRYELVNLAMKTYVEEYQFKEGETMLPTVYHVLYPSLNLETGEALSDEEKAEAKKKAEALKASVTSLDDLKAKADEAVANKEAAEAAEYTVSLGQMVKPFEEWCFAEHKIGDIDVVETIYGYHVIYFVGQKEADDEQKYQIATKAMQKEMNDAVEAGGYEAEIK